MPWSPSTDWLPTRLLEVAGSADTSTGATEVNTDAGRAYIKPMGNRQGPHVLATDWVGTHLAKWFGLSTFDIAILHLGDDDAFPLPRERTAHPGPAFAARAEPGHTWGRSTEELDPLVNPDDISRLVVFDTWTLNCDRHHHDAAVRRSNYDNVYLSSEGVAPGTKRLIAMDHGLCFIRSGEDLTGGLSGIGKVKDEHIYGLFPEFRARLRANVVGRCVERLREMDMGTASAMIATVPPEWEVSPDVRAAWAQLIYRRASYVADTVEAGINALVPWFTAEGG